MKLVVLALNLRQERYKQKSFSTSVNRNWFGTRTMADNCGHCFLPVYWSSTYTHCRSSVRVLDYLWPVRLLLLVCFSWTCSSGFIACLLWILMWVVCKLALLMCLVNALTVRRWLYCFEIISLGPQIVLEVRKRNELRNTLYKVQNAQWSSNIL